MDIHVGVPACAYMSVQVSVHGWVRACVHVCKRCICTPTSACAHFCMYVCMHMCIMLARHTVVAVAMWVVAMVPRPNITQVKCRGRCKHLHAHDGFLPCTAHTHRSNSHAHMRTHRRARVHASQNLSMPHQTKHGSIKVMLGSTLGYASA